MILPSVQHGAPSCAMHQYIMTSLLKKQPPTGKGVIYEHSLSRAWVFSVQLAMLHEIHEWVVCFNLLSQAFF